MPRSPHGCNHLQHEKRTNRLCVKNAPNVGGAWLTHQTQNDNNKRSHNMSMRRRDFAGNQLHW